MQQTQCICGTVAMAVYWLNIIISSSFRGAENMCFGSLTIHISHHARWIVHTACNEQPCRCQTMEVDAVGRTRARIEFMEMQTTRDSTHTHTDRHYICIGFGVFNALYLRFECPLVYFVCSYLIWDCVAVVCTANTLGQTALKHRRSALHTPDA